MAVLINAAEGGTHGTTVTPANSGGASGNAFTTVLTSGSGTVKYDNTQAAHGAMSIRHITTGPDSIAYVQWTITPAAKVAIRAYVRFSAMPAVSVFLITAGGGDFIVNAAGKFQISDLNAVQVTFASVLSAGVWYRIELETQAGTTSSNGYVAGRYFVGDSTTPAETGYASSIRKAGIGTPNVEIQFGQTLASGAVNVWMDDYALNDGTITPIGPAAVAATGTAAMALAATATAVPADLFAGWGIPL